MGKMRDVGFRVYICFDLIFLCDIDLGSWRNGGGIGEPGWRKPRERRAKPAVERPGAGSVPSNRQHQSDHEEGGAGEREDCEGFEGNGAGVCVGVHQLYHKRVSLQTVI